MYNILYVEDDANSRQVFKMAEQMIPNLFYTTIFADSVDFENRIQQLDHTPDLIFLDIHVPPHSGFDMLEMIRQNPDFDNVPVAALTASVMNDEVEMLKHAGFQGVLGKPIDLDILPEVIEQLIDGVPIWHI
ncbi:MAG: response regulator [Chloroflexota bacterium]